MKIHEQQMSRLIKLTLAIIVTTMLLIWGWNSAMPDLFGLTPLGFKQAVGLLLLTGIASIFLRRSLCWGNQLNHRTSNEQSVRRDHP